MHVIPKHDSQLNNLFIRQNTNNLFLNRFATLRNEKQENDPTIKVMRTIYILNSVLLSFQRKAITPGQRPYREQHSCEWDLKLLQYNNRNVMICTSYVVLDISENIMAIIEEHPTLQNIIIIHSRAVDTKNKPEIHKEDFICLFFVEISDD